MEKRRVYLNNGFNSFGIFILFVFSVFKYLCFLLDKVKCICCLFLFFKLWMINFFFLMEWMILEVCEVDRFVFFDIILVVSVFLLM